MHLHPFALGLTLLLIGASLGHGQDRDRRSGFEPRDIIRRLDDNNNGIIEPNEVSDRSRAYLADAAKRAGLDMNQPMAADRLLAALEQAREAPNSGDSSSSERDRSRSSSGSSSSSIKPPAGLNGFGPPAGGALPGFGAPGAASNAALEAKYDRRILDYVEGMLRDQDKNRDGFIDSIEWQSGRWRDPPETSDTNKDGRLSKEELCVRIAARYGDSSGGSSSGSGSGSSSSGSSSSGSSSSDASKFRSYAESLLRQYDKNKNGYLEKDEWSEMKSEHRGADTNADAVITVDELTNRLQAYSGGGSSSSSGGSSSGGSSSPSSTSSSFGSKSSYGSRGYGATPTNPSDRKSYRVSTATERLPKGLPDWFLRGDADADGQLRMVEYAASWNEETAAQFFKYDLNGDGIITPDECLIVDKKK